MVKGIICMIHYKFIHCEKKKIVFKIQKFMLVFHKVFLANSITLYFIAVYGGFVAHGSFSTIFYKGDNFCDFLYTFLHTKPLLKRGLLQKERICSQGEQILSFWSRPLFRRDKTVLTELPPLKVDPFPLSFWFGACILFAKMITVILWTLIRGLENLLHLNEAWKFLFFLYKMKISNHGDPHT